MLFLKSLSTSDSGHGLTWTTAGAYGDGNMASQSRKWLYKKKLVRGTQKHRTVLYTSASVVSSDFSGMVVLEALDPAVLE